MKPPLWLTRPTRFAALSHGAARGVLALIVLLLAATFLALDTPGPPPGGAEDQADVLLYDGIVESMRHGGDYYTVAADALRSGNYPIEPLGTLRLPTLAAVQAVLPPALVLALLWSLALAVVVVWHARLRPAFARMPARIVAMILLAAGMAMLVQPALVAIHEIWAGLMIALSLGLRRPGRWVEAAAIGLAAMLIRETAALYVAAMACLAFVESERREALGWLAAVGVFAIAVAAHVHAVAQVVAPPDAASLDPGSPGWAGILGFGYFVRAMAVSTPLAQIPSWLAAPLVGLALAGWAAWRDPLALRAFTILALYAALFGIAGSSDPSSWGLVVAPTLLVGLAFVPDAARDLLAAALDKRRITVKRVAR
ncbi:hypothetical protein [Sphingomonas sp.]|jgi:hypothetical protein|uniref:hypothetical protein n=1 Tax=Sphingomonas sp. TaxID=28214 RepID=UPI002ED79D92